MRLTEKLFTGVAAALVVLATMPAHAQTSTQAQAVLLPPSTTYTNPLALNDPKTGPVVSCPDPAVIKQNQGSSNPHHS